MVLEQRRRLLDITELKSPRRRRHVGESSVVHEMKQPLAAIASNASATLRWLARETPDLERGGPP